MSIAGPHVCPLSHICFLPVLHFLTALSASVRSELMRTVHDPEQLAAPANYANWCLEPHHHHTSTANNMQIYTIIRY